MEAHDISQQENNGKGQILGMADILQVVLQSIMDQGGTYEIIESVFAVVMNMLMWQSGFEYSNNEFPVHTTLCS